MGGGEGDVVVSNSNYFKFRNLSQTPQGANLIHNPQSGSRDPIRKRRSREKKHKSKTQNTLSLSQVEDFFFWWLMDG